MRYNGLNMTTGCRCTRPPGVLPEIVPIPRPVKGQRVAQNYCGDMLGQQGHKQGVLRILPPGQGQPLPSTYYR